MDRSRLVDDQQRHHGVKPAARIRVVHRDSAGTYGVLLIAAELCGTGHPVIHERAARVMRETGWRAPKPVR